MYDNIFSNYSKEQIKEALQILLTMEWLGIHIENIKDTANERSYYFSVPEKSTMEVKDKKANEQIKTSDGLIAIAKEELIDMMIDSCNNEFGDDKELFEDIKNNISDYVKFYAKIRVGEIWNKELGKAAVDKLLNIDYKEV